ncbi:unnamed protein product [Calicophoron daubneyi]|uniref:PAS domain-containing protein n=1 Tax=Calicophoron daubneyi TaxID=300641 RepID=A0AAV2T9E1_CALDB
MAPCLSFCQPTRPVGSRKHSGIGNGLPPHGISPQPPEFPFLPSISEQVQSEVPEVKKETRTAVIDRDQQASVRREKSRIAAKFRRQKENQALVKLRLALPIQQYKPSTDVPPLRKDSGHMIEKNQSSTAIMVSDNCALQTECALYSVPNYRAANTLSRQHHLAPEFEKAVTVRLAGNALCLYDWLYTQEHADSFGPPVIGSLCGKLSPVLVSSGGAQTDRPLIDLPKHCSLSSSLGLFSRSLVGIIVDTVENTVVFAPPSYAQLIGISWNATIGLNLHELRSRQLSTSQLSPHVSKNKIPKINSCQSSIESGCSSPCLSSSSLTDSSTSLRLSEQNRSPFSVQSRGGERIGRSGCRNHSFSSSSSRRASTGSSQLNGVTQSGFTADLWRCTQTTGGFAQLTTLLPPGSSFPTPQLSNALYEDAPSDDVPKVAKSAGVTSSPSAHSSIALRQSSTHFQYAVCWSVAELPYHSPPGESSSSSSSWLQSISSKSSSSARHSMHPSSTLSVCLIHPVSLRPAAESLAVGCMPALDVSGDSTCTVSVDAQVHISQAPSSSQTLDLRSVDSSSPNPTLGSTLSDLSELPRTYHLLTDLRFLDVQPSFLFALGWKTSQLLGLSLLDLIHPDDLTFVATALDSITEIQPIITAFHRLRCESGEYRWARFLAFLHTGNSGATHERPNGIECGDDDQLLATRPPMRTNSSRAADQCSCPFRSAREQVDRKTPGRLRPTEMETSLTAKFQSTETPTTSPTLLPEPISPTPTVPLRLVICCHQFAHVSLSDDMNQSKNLSSLLSGSTSMTDTDRSHKLPQFQPDSDWTIHDSEFAEHLNPLERRCFSATSQPSLPQGKHIESPGTIVPVSHSPSRAQSTGVRSALSNLILNDDRSSSDSLICDVPFERTHSQPCSKDQNVTPPMSSTDSSISANDFLCRLDDLKSYTQYETEMEGVEIADEETLRIGSEMSVTDQPLDGIDAKLELVADGKTANNPNESTKGKPEDQNWTTTLSVVRQAPSFQPDFYNLQPLVIDKLCSPHIVYTTEFTHELPSEELDLIATPVASSNFSNDVDPPYYSIWRSYSSGSASNLESGDLHSALSSPIPTLYGDQPTTFWDMDQTTTAAAPQTSDNTIGSNSRVRNFSAAELELDRGPFLPQAEIYAVPSGYVLHPEHKSSGASPSAFWMSKRKRSK